MKESIQMTQTEKLLSPYKIAGTTIKNRFIMAPMLMHDYFDDKGEITDDGIAFYEERAQGGFGLIYTGAFVALNEADNFNPGGIAPLRNPQAFIHGARDLTDRCHLYGSRIFGEVTFGHGRNRGEKTPSPAEMLGTPGKITRAYTTEEIKEKIKAMIDTAVVLKQAGFDGVDVHGLHWGYVLEQFVWDMTNTRDDEYGGSLENRLRPCKEIIEGIKEACGKDFPVTIRVDAESYISSLNMPTMNPEQEAGINLEKAVKIAKLLESYGYDAIMVDCGVYESLFYGESPMYIEKGYTIPMAKAFKKELKVPVIVTGSRLDEEKYLIQSVQEDTGDAVALGRAALADPFLPKKYETGKIDDVRPCIGCNSCIQTMAAGLKLECAVNPMLGKEGRVSRPSEPKKIIVIGGGAAGMEAARTLKLKGHDVSVYEKSDHLGGNLKAAGAHSFKHDVERLNQWYQKQMDELQIPVELNHEATAEELLDLKPDTVVFAVGSKPKELKFEGSDLPKVMNCLDGIFNEDEIGDDVVVVGGGQIGCETALSLSRAGKHVTIVEFMDNILSAGAAVPFMNKAALQMLLAQENVAIRTGTKIESVDNDGANVVTNEGEAEKIKADNVILSVGMVPNTGFEQTLDGSGIEVYTIGDGAKVGDIHTSVKSAHETASRI